jgi:hypothetical protein
MAKVKANQATLQGQQKKGRKRKGRKGGGRGAQVEYMRA